jgi:hypothetical protein
MNMNVSNANYNSNADRSGNIHMQAQTHHQNAASGRVPSNGNSGRRSIKSLQRNGNANQIQAVGGAFQEGASPVGLYDN